MLLFFQVYDDNTNRLIVGAINHLYDVPTSLTEIKEDVFLRDECKGRKYHHIFYDQKLCHKKWNCKGHFSSSSHFFFCRQLIFILSQDNTPKVFFSLFRKFLNQR